ncbi:MAG: prefoldin subunit beta [Thermoplasmatota archaeon]
MAETPISPQLQAQIQQLSNLNQQLQGTLQQRAQLEAMKSESEQAVAALEGVAADAPVYRSVGAILVRESSKEVALARLKEDLETLGVRLSRIGKQEASAKESLKALQAKIQAQLPS